jgi:hypothetical protein
MEPRCSNLIAVAEQAPGPCDQPPQTVGANGNHLSAARRFARILLYFGPVKTLPLDIVLYYPSRGFSRACCQGREAGGGLEFNIDVFEDVAGSDATGAVGALHEIIAFVTVVHAAERIGDRKLGAESRGFDEKTSAVNLPVGHSSSPGS